MSFERLPSRAQQLIGFAWVMFLVFLALSGPAHAVFRSELAAALFQVVGGAVAGGLFAARRSLARHARRTAALLADWTRDREIRSRSGVEGADRLGFHS